MIKLSLSKAEAFALLLSLESFLPDATQKEAEAIESLLIKAQSLQACAPFRSAKEARLAFS
jgi:hypothetical protein